MGEDKVEQNASRLSAFLFHTLGCGKEDVRRIFGRFVEKYLDGRLEHDKQGLKDWNDKIERLKGEN